VKKVALIILLIIVGAPVLWGSINYTGFCISEGGWLSEEERIALAKEAVFKSGPNKNYPLYLSKLADEDLYKKKLLAQGGKYKRWRYKTLEAFDAENPNCCRSVGASSPQSLWPDMFESRITGSRADVIEVKYIARFVGPEGDILEFPDHAEYPFISNCGHVFTNLP